MGIGCSSEKKEEVASEWNAQMELKQRYNIHKFFPTFDCANKLDINENDDFDEWIERMETEGQKAANHIIIQQQLTRINMFENIFLEQQAQFNELDALQVTQRYKCIMLQVGFGYNFPSIDDNQCTSRDSQKHFVQLSITNFEKSYEQQLSSGQSGSFPTWFQVFIWENLYIENRKQSSSIQKPRLKQGSDDKRDSFRPSATGDRMTFGFDEINRNHVIIQPNLDQSLDQLKQCAIKIDIGTRNRGTDDKYIWGRGTVKLEELVNQNVFEKELLIDLLDPQQKQNQNTNYSGTKLWVRGQFIHNIKQLYNDQQTSYINYQKNLKLAQIALEKQMHVIFDQGE